MKVRSGLLFAVLNKMFLVIVACDAHCLQKRKLRNEWYRKAYMSGVLLFGCSPPAETDVILPEVQHSQSLTALEDRWSQFF